MSLGTVAFIVVVLELVAAAGAVIALRRFWRRVEPTLRPMLAMFLPPTTTQRIDEYTSAASTSSSSTDRPVGDALPPDASPPGSSS